LSYPITTSHKIIKELQWVKEITKGTTPSSPIFIAIPTQSFNPFTRSENIKYRKLGAEDFTRTIRTKTTYDFTLNYAPIDSTLLKSMINVRAVDVDVNRENSFTFLISQEQNDSGTLTEQYQIARGCMIDSVTITSNSGVLIIVVSQWVAFSISDWSTAHGLTTPSFASALTSTPWASLTTGANPLTFNGNSYDVKRFSTTINQNPLITKLLDQAETTWIQPTVRDITIDLDIVYKDTSISADVKTLTPRTMTMSLNAVGADWTTLTFTDVYLEAYDESVSADSTEAKIVSYEGFAGSVTITITGPNFILTNFIPENFVVMI
jgi:hypothetical protein